MSTTNQCCKINNIQLSSTGDTGATICADATDLFLWKDSDDKTCADYDETLCESNNGFTNNFPEYNCCKCGKVASVQATPIPEFLESTLALDAATNVYNWPSLNVVPK